MWSDAARQASAAARQSGGFRSTTGVDNWHIGGPSDIAHQTGILANLKTVEWARAEHGLMWGDKPAVPTTSDARTQDLDDIDMTFDKTPAQYGLK